MTIQQCKYVVAIARFGSMNEAAKSLLVSQASLSSAVRDLEEEFGIRIFDRSNKGVQITKDGSEFIRYARQLIAQYDVINDRYQSGMKNIRNFSVTAQHYDFVAEAFISFMQDYHSDYNISLKEARTAEVIEDVVSLRADVGILAYLKAPAGGYMERYLKRKGLSFRPILETSPYVFLGKHHPLADRKMLSLEELADLPYVTYDQGDTGPIEFSEELADNRSTRKQIRISDRATLMNLLLSTESYTIGTGIMTSELNNGNVVSVKLNSNDVYAIVLIHRADVSFSEETDRFVKVLTETVSKRV